MVSEYGPLTDEYTRNCHCEDCFAYCKWAQQEHFVPFPCFEPTELRIPAGRVCTIVQICRAEEIDVLTHYQTTNFRLFQTESLQTTISNFTKMAESYPNR